MHKLKILCESLYTVSPYCCHFRSRIVCTACCDCIGSPAGLKRNKRTTHWEQAPQLWSLVGLRSNYESWLGREKKNQKLTPTIRSVASFFPSPEKGGDWEPCLTWERNYLNEQIWKCLKRTFPSENTCRIALPTLLHFKHNKLLMSGDSRRKLWYMLL